MLAALRAAQRDRGLRARQRAGLLRRRDAARLRARRARRRAATRAAASATFLTTMLDFADPGEIGVYVSRQMLAAREPALMAGQRVHGSELAGAFASLRPERPRLELRRQQLPEGAHAAGVRSAVLERRFGQSAGPDVRVLPRGRCISRTGCAKPAALTMLGESIDLSRIGAPAYVYASREDHIVPWRSAYATMHLLGGDADVRSRRVRTHRRRRQSAAVGQAQLLDERHEAPAARTTGSRTPRVIREAGGRTGIAGSEGMPAAGAQHPRRPEARPTPRLPRPQDRT